MNDKYFDDNKSGETEYFERKFLCENCKGNIFKTIYYEDNIRDYKCKNCGNFF